MTFEPTKRIRVDAPDAAAAFLLERRLSHLHPSAVARGSRWCVELEDSEDRADEITAAVRHWLRESSVHHTSMWIDGSRQTIYAPPAARPLSRR